jgi:hypothetical protein
MSQIKRYDVDTDVDGGRMLEHPLGDYIKYDDHKQVVKELEDVLRAWRDLPSEAPQWEHDDLLGHTNVLLGGK